MWNFACGLNNYSGFGNFGLFSTGFMTPSFFNFGFGQSFNRHTPYYNFGLVQSRNRYTPMFDYNKPTYTPSITGNFGHYSYTNRTAYQQPQTNADYIARINNLSSNTQRIIEYNKTNYKKDYYGIVDKENYKLTIYDNNGKIIETFNIGVGKDKGDGLSGGKYTTAGEFTLDENVRGKDEDHYISQTDGKYKFMALRGDNVGYDNLIDGIHMVPNNLQWRNDIIKSGKNANISSGCVNMLEKDYDKMYAYLNEGCKIYILPEEQGNELKLKEQTDGSYKFEQTYHQDDVRAMSNDVASIVIYDA